MSTFVNVWGACCTVCEKKIGIVQEWLPHGDGIRHWNCRPDPESTDGEWIEESVCRSCGTPCDAGEECPFCQAVTDTRIAREWKCHIHAACFCWGPE